MTNEQILKELHQIGKLPTTNICNQINFPLQKFIDLLNQITVPVSFDEAVQLINLSPPVDESCCEVEWTLIHLVETFEDNNQYQNILDLSENGEVKQVLQLRFDNYSK